MAYSKCEFKDGETVITAEVLNRMQDAICNLETDLDNHREADNPHNLDAEEVGATPKSHAEDKNNPHGVTAEQVGARPNTWLPTIAEIGAMPVESTLIEYSQIDNIKANGNYKFSSADVITICNIDFKHAYMRVDGFDNSQLRQTLFLIHAGGIILTRFCHFGVWQPWECVNPPMTPGAEYRTTKRHDGKAVYTKLLSYSPSSFTSHNTLLPHGVSNLDVGLSISVAWNREGTQWRHFPSVYYSDTKWNGQVFWANGTDLCFELGETLQQAMLTSSRNIEVTVEYTKNA